MKRIILHAVILSLLVVLGACSNVPSIGLIAAEVELTSDPHKVGYTEVELDNGKHEKISTTSLYYTFSIKNEGNRKIGKENAEEGLRVKIEPHEKLLTASEKVMGFNLFDESTYENHGVGKGYSYVNVLKPDESSDFIIYYDLGYEATFEDFPPAPTQQQLDLLITNALEATLIVTVGNEEIARFDLSKEAK
ncbi:hypothetical protein IEO70_10045 [Bacillus sp. AGMB 02131]|uniref:Lipoprotein n=1 Tax=Peribacillus faecalis TaxID=2772559 RepID=A0A927CVS7_9BACI|nr:hypothetical protein [Peribacillus faecalis]MBD3108708.1 hypothetical protein [Peribacillus faecalis]